MGALKRAEFRKTAHCTKATSLFAVPRTSDFGFPTKLPPHTPLFFAQPGAKGNAQKQEQGLLKGNVREQEKSPARKEVKKLSIEESVKVATGSGLISVNVSPLISFTSRAIVGVYCVGKRSPNRTNAPLLLRPFVRAREWECFVSGMNHGLSSRPDASEIVLRFGHTSMDTF